MASQSLKTFEYEFCTLTPNSLIRALYGAVVAVIVW